MSRRVDVAVEADFDEYGAMKPRAIRWRDGRRFEIDRIMDVRRAASLKAGGNGIRFRVRILGQERFLFFEPGCNVMALTPGKWFLEMLDR